MTGKEIAKTIAYILVLLTVSVVIGVGLSSACSKNFQEEIRDNTRR